MNLCNCSLHDDHPCTTRSRCKPYGNAQALLLAAAMAGLYQPLKTRRKLITELRSGEMMSKLYLHGPESHVREWANNVKVQLDLWLGHL
jgi:hypothetical protein